MNACDKTLDIIIFKHWQLKLHQTTNDEITVLEIIKF